VKARDGIVVGLIVNPAAGRDIRRLVGAASVMTDYEKSSIVRRVLRGLEAAGTEGVLFLHDGVGIIAAALDSTPSRLDIAPLPLEPNGNTADTVEAARQLGAAGVGAIVTLGGDGTNRAAASACGDVPLVAISTGTNNVIPSPVEGTVAGFAAGLVAAGAVDIDIVAPPAKWVEISNGAVDDVALVDVAVCRHTFRGAAAIWDPDRVQSLVLSRAEPWAVGLSSIGGRLRPISDDEPAGLYLELGSGGHTVTAVIAPGLVQRVAVRHFRLLALDEQITLKADGGIVALDGERELPIDGQASAQVTAHGPRVVDIRRVLELTARGQTAVVSEGVL
jgi:predicted polyphosphate/ATP-dependent NAD kinase